MAGMARELRLRRVGDGGLLVELDSLEQVIGLTRALADARPGGVIDVIPAARTLLVRFEPEEVSRTMVGQWLSTASRQDADDDRVSDTVEVPVRYDGADLAEVARLTGLTAPQVVGLHSGAIYTVAFCGFSPGFAYLSGSPAALRVPRRSSPRTKVPAGAVALAGEFTGVYPRESPGGWQLIGHTDLVTFDLEKNPPALLTPGTLVRFIEATG